MRGRLEWLGIPDDEEELKANKEEYDKSSGVQGGEGGGLETSGDNVREADLGEYGEGAVGGI